MILEPLFKSFFFPLSSLFSIILFLFFNFFSLSTFSFFKANSVSYSFLNNLIDSSSSLENFPGSKLKDGKSISIKFLFFSFFGFSSSIIFFLYLFIFFTFFKFNSVCLMSYFSCFSSLIFSGIQSKIFPLNNLLSTLSFVEASLSIFEFIG